MSVISKESTALTFVSVKNVRIMSIVNLALMNICLRSKKKLKLKINSGSQKLPRNKPQQK